MMKKWTMGTALLIAMMGILMPATTVEAKPKKSAKVVQDLSAEEIVAATMSKGGVGFKPGALRVQMTVVNASGDKKDRTLNIKAMRGADGLFRSLVKFEKPADVSGTSFLVLEKKDALPDQFVYVPKAKIVRRIAAGNLTSSFFGTDFTYADLMPLPTSAKDQVAIQKLPNSELDSQPVYVLEMMPKIKGSPYGKIVTYVHRELLIPLKVEFFDPELKALKTFKVRELKKMEGQFVPVKFTMESVSGAHTDVEILDALPESTLKESDFSEDAMQRE